MTNIIISIIWGVSAFVTLMGLLFNLFANISYTFDDIINTLGFRIIFAVSSLIFFGSIIYMYFLTGGFTL